MPLCILRHIFLARVLHCGQKRILGVRLGRRGIMLGNRSRGRFKNLPLGKLRQRRILCAVLVRLCFERGAKTGVNVFPACHQDRFALGGELLAAAIKNRRNGFILLRRGNGTQQLAADKGHQLLFALRQSIKAAASKGRRGDNRVMVGNLGAVDDAPDLRHKLRALHKGKHRQQRRSKVSCRLRHILGEVIAVGAGIGQEALFIQALCIVKGLLGGKAVNAVGFPLQGGKVKELRRQRSFLLLFERNANGLRRFASRFQRIRSGSVGNAFTFRVHAAAADMYDVVFFLVEHRNFSVALHQQIQRRRKHPSHIQGLVIQHGEKPRRIDTHKPICPRTAQRRLIQRVVFRSGSASGKALADGAVLHRGNPKTGKGLCASGLLIDKAETQLALAPGIAAVHHLGNVAAVQQFFQNGKLLFLAGSRGIFPCLRQNGKILIAPLFVSLVIAARVCHADKMPNAPRHQQSVAGKIPVFLLRSAQRKGNGLCHRGLFTNNQNTHSSFSCLSGSLALSASS